MFQALRAHLTPRRQYLLVSIAVLSMAALLLSPPMAHPKASAGFAIVIAIVGLFATGALPGLAISVLFFALALVSGVVPLPVLVSSFWANATLLIFGGLILGTATERSGLGRAIARGLMLRFLSSYPKTIFGILVGTLSLSFLVPSTVGRLAMTVPIVTALAREAGYEPGSKGYVGMMLTTVVGNFLTSYAIMPSNLVNVIVLGAAETLYGPQTNYIDYIWQMGPVLGLVRALLFWALVLVVFPAPPPAKPSATEPIVLGLPARRLAVVLALTVLLWATDFIHGLKPGWVALIGGLLCLLPPIALVRLPECFDLNRLTAVIAVPTVLGVANVLTYSGAGSVIADQISHVVALEGHAPWVGYAAIALMSSITAVIATIVGAIAIVTPLIKGVAAATGLPIKMGVFAEITGLQIVFFHFEAVPIIVGLAMSRISPGTAFRLLLPLAITGLLFVLPLQILWLRLLGALP